MTQTAPLPISRRTFIAAGGALALWPHGMAGQTPTAKPIKIGIIGSGRQGGAIGMQWARAGHQIVFSSRNPDSLKDLVAQAGPNALAGTPQQAAVFGEVVLIAVPYGALPQVGKDYAALMKGKVVIDVGNPRVDRDGEVGKDALARGTGVTSKEYLPGVRLVRALNALSFVQVTKEAHRVGEKLGDSDCQRRRRGDGDCRAARHRRRLRSGRGGRSGAREGIRRRHAGLREGLDGGAAQGGVEAAVAPRGSRLSRLGQRVLHEWTLITCKRNMWT